LSHLSRAHGDPHWPYLTLIVAMFFSFREQVVSTVGACQFAPNCPSISADALSIFFASRFSSQANLSSCSKGDDNSCITVSVAPYGHSRGLNIVVCVCGLQKVTGAFVLPSAETLSIIAPVLLTRFARQDEGMRYSNAASIRAIFVRSRSHVRYLGEHYLIPFRL
jgi:hypothetical protein